MSTDLLERTDTFEVIDTEEETKNDDPRTRHYIHREKTFSRAMEGLPAIALCGFVLPEFPTYNTNGPICGECQEIWEGFSE